MIDFFAKMCGCTCAYLILVYYRIRYPFSWRKKFDAAYEIREKKKMVYIDARKPGDRLWVAGDYPITDIVVLNEVIRSFTLGNSIVPNSEGKYICIKRPKSEDHHEC